MSNSILADVFRRRQEVLSAALDPSNHSVIHPTAKGDHSELHWIEMFRAFLPDRFSVDKGEVVDSDGSRSEAQDLIIYDRLYTPPLDDTEDYKVLAIESVYGVFEIKPELSAETYAYAVDKAKSVRELVPSNTVVDIPSTGGVTQHSTRTPISGLLTSKSGVKDPAILIPSWWKKHGALDLVCTASDSAYSIRCDKKNILVNTPPTTDHLIWFCVNLFDSLRSLGTAAPVDLNKYMIGA
ncbi:hypothetical protein JYU04_02620 [Dehalococcoides mccartyi]|nr:hypothetical protein [Dehalococcoides mccartyi]